jgi:hypothetical protein
LTTFFYLLLQKTYFNQINANAVSHLSDSAVASAFFFCHLIIFYKNKGMEAHDETQNLIIMIEAIWM